MSDELVQTHSTGCHMFGHRHYECALREIERLRAEVEARKAMLQKAEADLAALRKKIDESARAVLQEGPGGRGYVKAHLSRVRNEGVPIGVPVALVVLD